MEDAKRTIVLYWGKDGERVIQEAEAERKQMSFDEFLNHCTACGGNLGGLLLTGIRELFPNAYNAIPNEMGRNAWECLCCTLTVCGITID